MRGVRSKIRNGLATATVFLLMPFMGIVRADDTHAVAAKPSAKDVEFFEKRIRPVLVQRCFECHSSATNEPKGGLRLDSRQATLDGGDSGPSIVPGKPSESLLIQALKHDGLEMPPAKKLPEGVIADFIRWIEIGAPDPRDAPPVGKEIAGLIWEAQFAERRQWWSLQPVAKVAAPQIDDAWAATPIDDFLLKALHEKQLTPAARADRATLARRLSFVLTGLPPDPDDVDEFVRDESPEAWARLVDRTLASPHFGERFARHWMDVVRYGDTYGYEWDIPAKGAWRYRDYLVRAFNDDVPFDQLVREQLAGDLLEQPRLDPVEKLNLSRIGPMFYQLGEKRHGDSSEFNGIHQEMIDNKIDAFSKAFQAMTVACARCHDHKLDAVAQSEYYALAGAFMSSRWVCNTVDLPERDADIRRQLKELKSELRVTLAEAWKRDVASLSSSTWTERVKALGDKKPALGDVLDVWARLSDAAADGKSVADVWKEIAAQYQAEHSQRSQKNAESLVPVADFRKEIPAGWSVEGVGVRDLVPCGDITVALGGNAAVARISHGGLVTNSLSPRMNGALRAPYNSALEPGTLHFEAAGGDFAARRTVYDNAFLTEKQVYLTTSDPTWLPVNPLQSMADRHIFIEWATKTSNPNFPPRIGLGGATTIEQEGDPRSWFAISRVVRQKGATAPLDDLSRFNTLLAGEAPATLEDVAARYREWFAGAVKRWSAGKATDDDVVLLQWLLTANLLTNNQSDEAVTASATITRLRTLVDRYRGLERQLAEPQTVHGMADIDPGYNYRLNIRGDYDQLGDAPPRGYVRALTGTTSAFTSSHSGRRELAEVVASPTNPLTARVYVNRVWQWLFGQGIVTTPDDFGHLGDRPSHPELLDYLAGRFVSEGWSTKKLVREIVLSSAWQQSGHTTEAARAADPDNRLLHHYPLRRLDAESLRDAVLATSGRLEQRLYGPAVDPNRAKEDRQKRLMSGPIDGEGRRSIYTKMTIMEVPRFLATFNQPDPKIPTGKRDVTNTAAQSLALLNDPLVQGQAETWARQLVQGPETTPADRLTRMFRTAYGRSPTPEELLRWTAAVQDFASARQISSGELMTNADVWKDAAHAVFNTKEMIYVR